MAEEFTIEKNTGIAVAPAGQKQSTNGASRQEAIADHEYNESEFNQLKSLYERTLGKISEGEIVKGRIVAINDSEVSVDIGFKSEGGGPPCRVHQQGRAEGW